MENIALIPARGGSKGIPRKCLRTCGGKPLLQYSIDAALNSKCFDEVILSTDDQEIAQLGRQLGAQVPFLRPSHLALDDTPMIEVISHLLSYKSKSAKDIESITLLQPTSPMRTNIHIQEATKLFKDRTPTALVSICEVPHQFNPLSVLNSDQNGFLSQYVVQQGQPSRRQDKPKVYARNGPAILIVRPEWIERGQIYPTGIIGYLMGGTESIDIDHLDDLKLAEYFLVRNY